MPSLTPSAIIRNFIALRLSIRQDIMRNMGIDVPATPQTSDMQRTIASLLVVKEQGRWRELREQIAAVEQRALDIVIGL